MVALGSPVPRCMWDKRAGGSVTRAVATMHPTAVGVGARWGGVTHRHFPVLSPLLQLPSVLRAGTYSAHTPPLKPPSSTFPVSSGPGCSVTEQGKFWGICGKGKGRFQSS